MNNGFLDEEGLKIVLEMLKQFGLDKYATFENGVHRLALGYGSIYMQGKDPGIYIIGYRGNATSTIYYSNDPYWTSYNDTANLIGPPPGYNGSGGILFYIDRSHGSFNGDGTENIATFGSEYAYIFLSVDDLNRSELYLGFCRYFTPSQYGKIVIPITRGGSGALNLRFGTHTIPWDVDVLTRTNTDNYTPTEPTHPATKGYVDTAIANIAGIGGSLEQDILEQLQAVMTSAFTYKGSVTYYSELPTNAKVGDTYNIVNASEHNKAGDNAVWDGSHWDVLSGTIDMSGYVVKDDIKDMAKKSDIKTKLSELENDTNFIDQSTLNATIGSLNLSMYQRITDNTLNTTSKNIPDAINEVLSAQNTMKSNINTLQSDVNSMQSKMITTDNLSNYVVVKGGGKTYSPSYGTDPVNVDFVNSAISGQIDKIKPGVIDPYWLPKTHASIIKNKTTGISATSKLETFYMCSTWKRWCKITGSVLVTADDSYNGDTKLFEIDTYQLWESMSYTSAYQLAYNCAVTEHNTTAGIVYVKPEGQIHTAVAKMTSDDSLSVFIGLNEDGSSPIKAGSSHMYVVWFDIDLVIGG